ncbi:conserved hypothetical protein [Neospora caninum Liverpool]|uniref:Uncharacterized protein n=1 Tax=Neospora caninum (strain Liverpool) TaxID=572307 RepID=F0VPB6_NEOCL|nr:conserved hypothetical protein [Neospora caninum Liverpool]CBZ55562.1 conserved hypothetical protein [Neospora caninum Liverpool]CEL70303.1 TPA: hypothetical protein BN1204_059870 [Neospora caninum Liverpool]|eukprot:XP_003885590.1 conserved hypothetical protein [Neospora caninum Liverpool]
MAAAAWWDGREEERDGAAARRGLEEPLRECTWSDGEGKGAAEGEEREKDETRHTEGERDLDAVDGPQPARGAWFLRNFSLRRRLGLIPGASSDAGNEAHQLSYPFSSSFSSSLSSSHSSQRPRGVAVRPGSASPRSLHARSEVKRAALLAPFASLRRQLVPAALLRLETRRNRLDGNREEEKSRGSERRPAREGRDEEGEDRERREEPGGNAQEPACLRSAEGGRTVGRSPSLESVSASARPEVEFGRRVEGSERRGEAEECGLVCLASSPSERKGEQPRGDAKVAGSAGRASGEGDRRSSGEREEELQGTQMKVEEQREALEVAEAALKLARERIRNLERDNASLRTRRYYVLSLHSTHKEGGRRANKRERGNPIPQPGHAGAASRLSPMQRVRGPSNEQEEEERGAEERESDDEGREADAEGEECRQAGRSGRRADALEQKLRLYQRQLLFISQENQRLRDVLAETRTQQRRAKAEERRKEKASIAEVPDVCTYVVSRPQFEL